VSYARAVLLLSIAHDGVEPLTVPPLPPASSGLASATSQLTEYASPSKLSATFTLTGNFGLLPMECDRYNLNITGATPGALTLSHSLTEGEQRRLHIKLKNTSGGAGPTITWSGFKLQEGTDPVTAVPNPATGFTAHIEFEFDGTRFREIWRSADIPN
jgi:hypothetical protein